jgi:hypothetical protein
MSELLNTYDAIRNLVREKESQIIEKSHEEGYHILLTVITHAVEIPTCAVIKCDHLDEVRKLLLPRPTGGFFAVYNKGKRIADSDWEVEEKYRIWNKNDQIDSLVHGFLFVDNTKLYNMAFPFYYTVDDIKEFINSVHFKIKDVLDCISFLSSMNANVLPKDDVAYLTTVTEDSSKKVKEFMEKHKDFVTELRLN